MVTGMGAYGYRSGTQGDMGSSFRQHSRPRSTSHKGPVRLPLRLLPRLLPRLPLRLLPRLPPRLLPHRRSRRRPCRRPSREQMHAHEGRPQLRLQAALLPAPHLL